MPIAPILVGVIVIVGVIALVLSGTTWRWYHITIVSFVMLLSVVWFYLAARTLKIQEAWRSEVTKWEKDYINTEHEQERIVNGGADPSGKEHPLSMDALKTENSKLLQGRGRVWTEVVKKAVGPDGKITATIEKPAPAGIEKNLIVYVYDSHSQKIAEDREVPIFDDLLGEFEVSGVNGQDVTLSPALKLRPTELQRYAKQRTGKLVLYEIIPTDSHDVLRDAKQVFKDMAPAEQKEKIEQLEDREIANQAFPGNSVPDSVKQEFANDGKAPAEGDTQSDRIWRRVKVLKDIYRPLTADEIKKAEQDGQTPETDPTTQKPAVKLIAAETEMVLDPKSAAERIAAGDAEPVAEKDKVYVRSLRDYARLLRDLNFQIEELLRATAETTHQNDAIKQAQVKVAKDIAYRTDEVARLKRDVAHYKAENALIKQHVAALEKELAKTTSDVEKMLVSNRESQAELVLVTHQTAHIIEGRAPAPAR